MPFNSNNSSNRPASPFDLPVYLLISIAVTVWTGLAAGVFIIRSAVRAFYPYLTNLGEPALAQSIGYVQKGIWPYHDLSNPPFSVVPYGPVYLGLAAAVQSFFPSLPMAGGRLVCLAATILSAVCIGLIVARTDRRIGTRVVAAGTACFFMSLPYVNRWGAQVNVDMTAVALELVALSGFFFYVTAVKPDRKFFWIGTIAVVAAVFTKSSAVSAAAAWGVYMLGARRWKDLALFCVAAGGSIAAIFFTLNHLTAGQYHFHTIHEISRRLFFERFITDYWLDMCLNDPLNVAAAVIAVASPVLWTGLQGRQSLLNLYLVFTVLITVSLGKQGSDTNYLLPFVAASTLAAGRIWSWFSRGWKLLIGIALVAGIGAQAVLTGGVINFSLDQVRGQQANQTAFYDKISETIQKFPDPIISWDMSLLIANGRPVYFELFPMAQAAYSGVWDQTPILNDLRARRIKLIVTYFWFQALKADRNFTPEFIAAMRENYQLSGQVQIPWSNQYLFFYIPKKS